MTQQTMVDNDPTVNKILAMIQHCLDQRNAALRAVEQQTGAIAALETLLQEMYKSTAAPSTPNQEEA